MNITSLNPFFRKLDLYLLKKFSKNFLMFFLILFSVVFLIEFTELLRRTSENADVQSLSYVFYLSILKSTESISYLLPWVTFITTMFTCWWLNRHREIVIMRNTGLTSIRILYPFIFFSLMLSVFYLAVFNPFLSYGINQYEKNEQKIFRGKLSTSVISKSGVWLRQGSNENKVVIRASSFKPEIKLFENVTFYIFTKRNSFVERIDAKKSELKDNYWHMEDVFINRPNKRVVNIAEYTLSTNLSIDKIENSFLDPQSISIWKLPEFIELLKQSGFSPVKHNIYLYKTFLSPLFLIGLILIAGPFTMKFTKKGGETAILILIGIIFGFLIYVITEYIYSLGIANKMPTLLASISPPSITIMVGIYFIIYFESA